MARTIVSRLLIPAALASLAALSLAPRSADACSCRPSPSAEAALAGSDAVFEARVGSVSPPPGTGPGSTGAAVTVKLTVLRAWKGAGVDVGREVTLSTPSGSATCGYTFQANETYVVFAMNADGGVLATNVCMRTKRSADAAADIVALNAAAPSGAQAAPSSGGAPASSSSADTSAPPFEANPGVPAVVTSAPPPPAPGPKPIAKGGTSAGCAFVAPVAAGITPVDGDTTRADAEPSGGAALVIVAALAALATRRPGRARSSAA